MRTLDPIRHAEKRKEILDAATRCIARDGFQGASTADICREAGISPGHLYHYFDSKEEIIAALTSAGLERAAARFAEIMQGDDAIEALIGEIGRHKGKKRDPQARAMSRMLLEMLVEAGRNAAIARIVRKNSAMLRALLIDFIESGQLRGQIDPGLDSKLAAGMLLSVMDGMRSLTIRDPDADIGRSLEMLQTLIARFLSPPKKR
jgi:TetR/AcrR family transcriptional regulator, repressor for uid operon